MNIKNIEYSNDWCHAITTNSKYFNIRVELDNGFTGYVEVRFSDHTKSGNDFLTENEELVEIGKDLYYEVGNFRVYSHSTRKNYKTIKSALQKCDQFIIDVYKSIVSDYYEMVAKELFAINRMQCDGYKFQYNAFKKINDLGEKYNIKDLIELSKQIFSMTICDLKNEIKTLAYKYLHLSADVL